MFAYKKLLLLLAVVIILGFLLGSFYASHRVTTALLRLNSAFARCSRSRMQQIDDSYGQCMNDASSLIFRFFKRLQCENNWEYALNVCFGNN